MWTGGSGDEPSVVILLESNVYMATDEAACGSRSKVRLKAWIRLNSRKTFCCVFSVSFSLECRNYRLVNAPHNHCRIDLRSKWLWRLAKFLSETPSRIELMLKAERIHWCFALSFCRVECCTLCKVKVFSTILTMLAWSAVWSRLLLLWMLACFNRKSWNGWRWLFW